jgi:hypothetical protein
LYLAAAGKSGPISAHLSRLDALARHLAPKASMSTALRLACVALVLAAATGCTNFMVTKGASEEGANMITYTDDGGNNYGELGLLHPDPEPGPSLSPGPNATPQTTLSRPGPLTLPLSR